MENDWIIIMRVAPHSTGKGQIEDQKMVGKYQQKYLIKADGIGYALNAARAIEEGIRSNPMVWMVEIKGIIQKGNGIET